MKFKLSIFIILFNFSTFGQDKRIDNLEILYSQKFYTKVIKKANKLLAIPDYDYSGMPRFYKAISMFKLVNDPDWYSKNNKAISKAIDIYDEFLTYPKAMDYTKSHYFEIADLKLYLTSLEKDLISKGKKKDAKLINKFISIQLRNVNRFGLEYQKNNSKPKTEITEKPNIKSNKKADLIREQVVRFAKKYLGVKYQWAGATPKGFDCSGFVGYVLKNYGILIPRTASEQKIKAQKLKFQNAFMGDLLFFKTGSKITHVGLVISKRSETLTMIHASTSKGIIITNVSGSSYWKPKLAAAGRYIK